MSPSYGHDHEHGDADGVIIGLREIYEQIRTVAMQYVEIKAALDTSIRMHTLQLDVVKTQVAELRQRIQDLEKRPTLSPKTMTTVISVVIAATGVIVGIVSVVTK